MIVGSNPGIDNNYFTVLVFQLGIIWRAAIKNEVGLSTKNDVIDRRSVGASQSEERRRRQIRSTLIVVDIACFTKSHLQPSVVCAVDQTISDARRLMSAKRSANNNNNNNNINNYVKYPFLKTHFHIKFQALSIALQSVLKCVLKPF